MKCNNDLCDNTMTEPTITCTVGDVKAGNYWGVFCSYKCALQEIAACWLHLDAGNSLASFKPDASKTVGFLEAKPEKEIAPNILVANTDEADQNAQPAETLAPDPTQPDHMAWEANDTESKKALEQLGEIENYSHALVEKLGPMIVSDTDIKPILFDGHKTNKRSFNIQADLNTVFSLILTPAKHDDSLKLLIDFNGASKYNIHVDTKIVSMKMLLPALTQHLKAAAIDYAQGKVQTAGA